jgi:hypothetical protein
MSYDRTWHVGVCVQRATACVVRMQLHPIAADTIVGDGERLSLCQVRSSRNATIPINCTQRSDNRLLLGSAHLAHLLIA